MNSLQYVQLSVRDFNTVVAEIQYLRKALAFVMYRLGVNGRVDFDGQFAEDNRDWLFNSPTVKNIHIDMNPDRALSILENTYGTYYDEDHPPTVPTPLAVCPKCGMVVCTCRLSSPFVTSSVTAVSSKLPNEPTERTQFEIDTLVKIDVMRQAVQGKAIQFKRAGYDWNTTFCPIWNWGEGEYRVRPSDWVEPTNPPDITSDRPK